MGPVKRSVLIAGHPTSISLEPVFWQTLREAAAADGLPLNTLVARIDAARLHATGDAPNLATEVARGLTFVCAEDGGFITGSTLSIDDGQHLY